MLILALLNFSPNFKLEYKIRDFVLPFGDHPRV
jgi:hypothetical protein